MFKEVLKFINNKIVGRCFRNFKEIHYIGETSEQLQIPTDADHQAPAARGLRDVSLHL